MVCLDTTFIIDLLKGRKEAVDFLERRESLGEEIYLNSINVMELIKGAYLHTNSDKEEIEIRGLISSFVQLDFDMECAVLAGKIEAGLISIGETLEPEDLMIGAIALQNGEAIVTRNKKHFERIKDLRIESY